MAKDLPPRGEFAVGQTGKRPAAKEGAQQQ
jgi:hypothetical protein